MDKQKKSPLTSEQMEALRMFAQYNGRHWKRELRYAWECGMYPGDADVAVLQSLQNTLGTRLVQFTFSEMVAVPMSEEQTACRKCGAEYMEPTSKPCPCTQRIAQ